MPRLHLLPSRISKFSGEDTLAPANQEGEPPLPPPLTHPLSCLRLGCLG
jgi:hypothetical protein